MEGVPKRSASRDLYSQNQIEERRGFGVDAHGYYLLRSAIGQAGESSGPLRDSYFSDESSSPPHTACSWREQLVAPFRLYLCLKERKVVSQPSE
jgi:hypothetical protein